MHILHGTWIPADTSEFVQSGRFYLWVETTPTHKTRSQYALKSLTQKELDDFLRNNLKIAPSTSTTTLQHHIQTCHMLLPGVDDIALPSPEIARRLALALPDDDQITPVSLAISAYPLPNILRQLEDLYFLATYQREELQLGHDLLFWTHAGRILQQVLRKDQYIPALKYRQLPGKGKKSTDAFEIRPGWQILSQEYESRLQQLLDFMPLVCAGGSEVLHSKPVFYDKESLLRHFSEDVLACTISQSRLPAVSTKKVANTFIGDCLAPAAWQTAWSSLSALERYRQWQTWSQALFGEQGEGFQLGFQLLEGADEHAPWHIWLLAASRQDPSLKLPLADYWELDGKAKKALSGALGRDFEARLMFDLGTAARMYPKLWQGLETDRPTGVQLSLAEAFDFLQESAWVLEDAGFKVIVPAWWTPQGRRRAKLRLKAGGGSPKTAAAGPGYFSLEGLVKYRYELAIGDQTVTAEEWRQLVDAKTPLVQFRGQWVELDRDKMQQMLEFWQTHGQGEAEITLGELLHKAAAGEEDIDVSQDRALAAVLANLQEPTRFEPIPDPDAIHGTLRDYQKRGVAWIQFLESLGLNGCLADDMGLGKTLQVITRVATAPHKGQTLLIAPISVVGNWQKEIQKFAPQLTTSIHHGPGRQQDGKAFRAACQQHDIVITSYNLARRDAKLLQGVDWQRVVVDEAQHIKNPKTAQTKAILKLKAHHRLALTGTPVENRLMDLWSIFHFLNPGYLNTQAQFRKQFELPIQKNNDPVQSARLKKLVQPFILRRLKTDKNIIKDLPDKVENKQYCNLTKEQASLYEAVVKEVAAELEDAEGIQRKGLILSTLMRLKQICNHPRQFLQDDSVFTAERSHKLERLSEMLAEVIAEGESLLIFTQFTEIGAELEKFLSRTLDTNTYYLHGGTSRTRREQMINAFQDPATEPSAFILSLKAGGVGINLTKANHVFHFDRWWNPAVENQATDRAFRIGQTRNVFVHKFITLGTLEERIDQMLEDKKQMADAIVGADESWLTELDNASFSRLIALNRGAVLD